jgi:amino acid transporter
MVGVTALIAGYMLGQIFPNALSSTIPSPLFMIVFCVVFSFGVSYIAFRGVGGTTGVNAAINVVQITALVIFSIMAITHRVKHPEGSAVWTMDSTGTPTQYVQKVDDKGAGVLDNAGQPVFEKNADGSPKLFTVSYQNGITTDPATGAKTFLFHDSAKSVVAPHGMSYVFIQACVAILILVGFESVTAMGEEARNAKRDIPIAVILSLVIQGCFCYALEYFAANYYIGSHYTDAQAGGSAAPIGDMMQLVGAWAFGSASAGWWFMMIQAVTVFLALIGTTLSCMSTAARVTYAMGRDEEVPSHFGLLHGKRNTPHTAIWTLAIISAGIGIFAILFNFCGPAAQTDATIAALPKNLWYSFGLFSNATAAKIPQSLLVVTLVSNFGTFLLYMMSCLIAIVAFHEHEMHSFLKHKAIPLFGLLANLACMLFYIVGPLSVPGMSPKEPFFALGVCGVWGLYGGIYFVSHSKKIGKPVLIPAPATTTTSAAV